MSGDIEFSIIEDKAVLDALSKPISNTITRVVAAPRFHKENTLATMGGITQLLSVYGMLSKAFCGKENIDIARTDSAPTHDILRNKSDCPVCSCKLMISNMDYATCFSSKKHRCDVYSNMQNLEGMLSNIMHSISVNYSNVVQALAPPCDGRVLHTHYNGAMGLFIIFDIHHYSCNDKREMRVLNKVICDYIALIEPFVIKTVNNLLPVGCCICGIKVISNEKVDAP